MVRMRVKELLAEKGHTKYWLFKRMGLSYQNISRIMDGETDGIRFNNMERLCKLLECTPNELFEIKFDEGIDELVEEADRKARKRKLVKQ